MAGNIDSTDLDVLLPTPVATEIIKELPQNSAVMRLGKQLPNMAAGTEKLPVLSALPLAYFVSGEPQDESGDKGQKKTTKAEWTNKVLTAEEIACIVPIKENYINDLNFDLWGEIKPSIVEAMGLVFDAAVLFGTNKPTSWPNAIYTDAVAKSKKVEIGADVFEELMGKTGVISKVEKDGYFPTGHVAALSMRGELRGLRDDMNRPIFTPSMQAAGQYELDGSPILFPLNGCMDDSKALLFTGAWNKLVYAIRQDVTYKVLTEAVIQDPATGDIVYNLAQQDMVALRVTMRIAWQLPNPVNRINGSSATRYPFSILTPAKSS